MHPAFLNTALCEMLGIRYPIMSAGMNDCAGPELVAAVSNAGGLGSLGTGRADADYMRQEIRKVKALTDRPFAVQFPAKPLVHPHEADLPQEHLDFIDGLRTEFNVPAPDRLPAPENEWWGAPSTPQSHQEVLQVILEEKVPVLVTFYGDPGGIAEQAHAHGVRTTNGAAAGKFSHSLPRPRSRHPGGPTGPQAAATQYGHVKQIDSWLGPRSESGNVAARDHLHRSLPGP
jgi:NAD(P)H-dependent flavin oxidoreductase YrpB (nitropropane dioxygenase family)